jgi:hypothetical protein
MGPLVASCVMGDTVGERTLPFGLSIVPFVADIEE